MLLFVLLTLSTPSSLAATAPPGCAAATSSSAVLANVTAAQAAYETLDQDAFNASLSQAQGALPCLGDLLSPTTAAAYARVQGLAAQLAGDRSSRQLWFRAALALDPETDLGQVIAPPEHPLRRAWDEARAAPAAERVELGEPDGVKAWVDGKVSGSRPGDRPALVQLVAPPDPDHPGDRVLWTSFAWPAPAMPTAAMLGVATPLTTVAPPKERSWGLPQTALAGAGASLLASAALYGVAYAGNQRYWDPDNPEITTPSDVDAAADRINGQVWASAGLGLVGVGLGVTALIVRKF